MALKPLDRHVVRTRDLLVDNEPHNEYFDPIELTAKKLWKEIS
jgi:hypothetical protein